MKSIIYSFSVLLFLLGIQQHAQAQLNTGFEGTFPPAGWAIFDNGVQQNQSWQQSSSNPSSGSAHAFIKFSSSTTELAEDWLVTPKLLPTMSINSLTFNAADDFAENFGSIYTVRVSTTSQTDRLSFEEVATYTESDFTADVYQSFSVDLSAYIDQEIYVAFVLENSKGDSWLLDEVSGPAVVASTELPNCDSELTSPDPDALNDVPVDITLAWTPASGDPLGYRLQIGTSQNGSEFLALTDIGPNASYKPVSDFAFDTRYYLTIVPYNSAGDAAACQVFEFTTEMNPEVSLDCGSVNTIVDRTLCYRNNEIEEFTLSASGGNQVQISFNGGTVENNQDELFIYDGTDDTGNLLNADKLYGNSGDFTGLSYVSTTGNLFIRLTPDASNDCASGNQTELDFTVSCEACTPPIVTSVVDDCDAMNDQFFINVDLSSLGNGTITASNDQNTDTQVISSTGVSAIGPFEFGTVIVTLENTDSDCNVVLPAITVEGCPPANDECNDAITLTASSDQNCNNSLSGTIANATASTESGICAEGNLDVWYSFTPTSTDAYVFDVLNANDLLSVAIYSGDCTGGLTLLNEECINEGRSTVDLTASTTYLVQVFSILTESDFDICVYPAPAAPDNDLCANAEMLDCPSDDLSGVDISFATATDAASCNGDDIGAGVWYQIVGDGGTFTLAVTPTDWDAEIQIWSGADCNSLACETFIDDGVTGGTETITDFQTVNGTNYYIYVGAVSPIELAGVFDLTLTCTANLCPSMLTISDNPVAAGDYRAEMIETANMGVVTIAPSTTVSFLAEQSVTLQAGFHAQAGSTFTARIEACPSNANSNEVSRNTTETPNTLETEKEEKTE